MSMFYFHFTLRSVRGADFIGKGTSASVTR